MARTTQERKRGGKAALHYAISHGIRVEILCFLNEGVYSASELAELTRFPLTTVSYHLKEMLQSGSIEVARVQKVRNADQYFYRAIEVPIVSDEEAAALPPAVKQEYAEVILQAILAESLGAFQTEKLNSDPRVRMMWSWHNVDEEGRDEIADEQLASWERITGIVATATNRRSETGERPTTVVTVTLGFERSRPVRGELSAAHHLPFGNTE